MAGAVATWDKERTRLHAVLRGAQQSSCPIQDYTKLKQGYVQLRATYQESRRYATELEQQNRDLFKRVQASGSDESFAKRSLVSRLSNMGPVEHEVATGDNGIPLHSLDQTILALLRSRESSDVHHDTVRAVVEHKLQAALADTIQLRATLLAVEQQHRTTETVLSAELAASQATVHRLEAEVANLRDTVIATDMDVVERNARLEAEVRAERKGHQAYRAEKERIHTLALTTAAARLRVVEGQLSEAEAKIASMQVCCTQLRNGTLHHRCQIRCNNQFWKGYRPICHAQTRILLATGHPEIALRATSDASCHLGLFCRVKRMRCS